MSIRHKFVSSIPDDNDPNTVGTDEWNDDHELVGLGQGRPFASGAPTVYVLPGVSPVGQSTGGISAGDRHYQAILVHEPLLLTGLVSEVVSGHAAGRAMQMGLYVADFNWQPGALVFAAEADASTAGVKLATTSPIPLEPGRYLTCMQSNNATTVWRVWTAHFPHFLTGASAFVRHLSVSATYGALPDPGLAWTTYTSGTTPTNHRVLLAVDEP